jgi:S-DNA-T family DNA segregation ATPase FtsK/SpoIIIE
MLRLSIDDQRRLVEQLSQLVAERIRSEASIRASFETRQTAQQEQFNSEKRRLVAKLTAEREEFQSNYSTTLSKIVRDYEKAVEAARSEHDKRHREITTDADHQTEELKANAQDKRERISAEFDASVRELQRGIAEFKERVEEHRKDLRELEGRARKIVRKRFCGRKVRDVSVSGAICDAPKPIEAYAASHSAATHSVHRLAHQKLPKFLFTFILLMLPIFVVTGGMLAAGLLLPSSSNAGQTPAASATSGVDPSNYLIGAAIGACALGLMGVVYVIVRPLVVHNTKQGYTEVMQQIATADVALDTATKVKAAEADIKKIGRHQQRVEQLRQVDSELQQGLDQIYLHRDKQLAAIAESLKQQSSDAACARDDRQQATNEQATQKSQQMRTAQETQLSEFQQREQQELRTSREMRDRSWERLVSHWKSGLGDIQQATEEMWAYCRERFPDWDSTDWETWRPPDEPLPAVQFGSYTIQLKLLEGGVPEHEDLRPDRLEYRLPAMTSFAERAALLYEAFGDGRAIASRSIQNVMLRLLTSLPAGKVRFTIIDPVGLGQNFSAFMHLKDFDEKLVTHRIWTDPNHINQRLSDLTEHMEDVIQTYLRNEFQTIDEYNRDAGEVAEPFHVLVVANFPAGFSDESASRLLSIVSSGSRCGVYTLISTDSKLEWPRNFNIADLEAAAATVEWNGNQFGWRDPTLKHLPLTLDDPPGDEKLTEIIRIIGQKAKIANRVEVPFATVAAKPNDWWSRDSRETIEVPLGRAGASKLQYLRLGKGTSQHVLISGKTGSGKSTLLHALIINTAIHYSPDEVEFYLIDFKKGVEFKPYASKQLPHARVIAIESEREFGMSVLERLDQELRIRGDRFREAGVQDIKNFRDQNPNVRMPRILLIIDEFQEFFTQDDKVAQDAALLLDRLVRQGRAFGIHVLLGSQTLAGAYSLARSTLGQMAIRIALQCSETDSHLILSEDNTAARLLNRPGEAIYNDANGLFEGNHPFQVVWLSAQEQENYLERIAQLPSPSASETPPAIVFEGSAPADAAENDQLRRLITSPESTELDLAPRAWLGAAIAIKEPTSAVFRRQSGANLLVVGQQEEMALAILSTAAISLGASGRAANGGSMRILVLDGTRQESPEAGWWTRFAKKLPLNLTVGTPASAGQLVEEVANEMARRAEAGTESEPPLFLLVHNLARFRDLRRSDDDLGFSSLSEEKPASPSKQLVAILRDGPAVGVHCLIWCDTYNTVTRWLDRSSVREMDQRVLFQMSANDSSNLMDSPAASRLGQHRAILYSEELGQQERFRPYGLPSADWLNWLSKHLAPRVTDESVL